MHIKRQRTLVGIQVSVQATALRILATGRKRRQCTGRAVAIRPFDLDHPRAEIGQQFAAVFARDVLAQFQHGNVLQG